MSGRDKKIRTKAKEIKMAMRIINVLTLLAIIYSGSIIYSVVKTKIDFAGITTNEDPSNFYILIPLNNTGIYSVQNISVDMVVRATCVALPTSPIVGTGSEELSELAPDTVRNFNISIDYTTNATIIAALLANPHTFSYQFEFVIKIHVFTVEIGGSM